MTRIYGHTWITNYGKSDDGTWLEGLRGLLPKDLAVGLHRVINSGEEWPPSLPKFRSYCLAIDDKAVDEYAKQMIRKSMDSFSYKLLTARELISMVKVKREFAREELIAYKLEVNNNLKLENKEK